MFRFICYLAIAYFVLKLADPNAAAEVMAVLEFVGGLVGTIVLLFVVWLAAFVVAVVTKSVKVIQVLIAPVFILRFAFGWISRMRDAGFEHRSEKKLATVKCRHCSATLVVDTFHVCDNEERKSFRVTNDSKDVLRV